MVKPKQNCHNTRPKWQMECVLLHLAVSLHCFLVTPTIVCCPQQMGPAPVLNYFCVTCRLCFFCLAKHTGRNDRHKLNLIQQNKNKNDPESDEYDTFFPPTHTHNILLVLGSMGFPFAPLSVPIENAQGEIQLGKSPVTYSSTENKLPVLGVPIGGQYISLSQTGARLKYNIWKFLS